MKEPRIQVSTEYLDDLCDKMLDWVKKPDSMTVPQFLKWKGLGYSYLKYFCFISDKVNNTFEHMRSILFCKWFDMAMKEKELPKHQITLLNRYIKYYDAHTMDLEKEIREKEAEVKAITEMRITAENYARAQLESPFADFYEDNANKRRGREEA
jgi:hypothetical protein